QQVYPKHAGYDMLWIRPNMEDRVPQTPSHLPAFDEFQALASIRTPQAKEETGWAIPIVRTVLADHLTPVTAYERLAPAGGPATHSFLLESVVGGERIARYSFLGANPRQVIKAHGHHVSIHNQHSSDAARTLTSADPLKDLEALLKPIRG